MGTTLGLSCVGADLGAMVGIVDIQFPEVTPKLDLLRTNSDESDAGKRYYQNYDEGAIVITLKRNVTLRNAMLTKSRAGTTDTFTVKRTGDQQYVGAAFVTVGSITHGDAEPTFQVTLTPETEWTASAA